MELPFLVVSKATKKSSIKKKRNLTFLISTSLQTEVENFYEKFGAFIKKNLDLYLCKNKKIIASVILMAKVLMTSVTYDNCLKIKYYETGFTVQNVVDVVIL